MKHTSYTERARRGLLSRRDLLELGALGALVSSLGGVARSAGSPDYRALVCVFLYGGADTFNLLVPTAPDAYATYAAARGDLAEPLDSLLPIQPLTGSFGPHGLHGSVPELRDLFQARRLAFVSNVGPLVQPVTKEAVLNAAAPVPSQLFAHNSQMQEWQIAWAKSTTKAGWLGRTLEQLAPLGTESVLPPGISIATSDTLLQGNQASPYVLGSSGVVPLQPMQDPARAAAFQALLDGADHPLTRAVAEVHGESIQVQELLGDLVPTAPDFEGLFPDSWLGLQLKQVARLIALRGPLGVSRQAFFVTRGGWDTHDDQPQRLELLLRELSEALGAFQAALDSIDAANQVVSFAHSEFGRTLSSNGKGSDHGWGAHSFALGGPVSGGDLYGELPNFALDGPQVLGEGRVLPSTAVDTYAATLARWFGVAPDDLPKVFPNLPNFAVSDLGLLG